MKYIITIFTLAMFQGCTYYQTTPVVYSSSPGPSKFQQSWTAVIGAFADQGVMINTQNQSAGVVQGHRSGIDLTATVRTQANGSVQVQFITAGATDQDPQLINRITQSYNRRMGR